MNNNCQAGDCPNEGTERTTFIGMPIRICPGCLEKLKAKIKEYEEIEEAKDE